ncbi:DUF3488 and transglutaminase-like domain-containing protein [Isoptericola sp. b441]|uniref:DUF3488 and transglutaminase-like domain-containing protein n=1 Tax=Actinotalea lenta TaxID=3064654 RepID=A0ABT9D941_9CELL|nr:DUF3488 and transglutaminase-like domain-containing protein [Isoptericola sp. b441]MDO8107417.1 DUF3488 and transglutaminase-like domain-containing protein [Isoptericola sp. b441]
MRFPAPLQGPVAGHRVWLGALVLLVAVRAGLGTLGVLLAPGPWLTAATVAAAVVLGVAALIRAFGASEWAPAAALGTAALVVAVGYGAAGDGPGIPGLGTPGRLADLVGTGITSINEGQIPVHADRGLELIVVAATALVAVVLDGLALAMRMAGLAGAVLASLWAPTLVFEHPPSTASLLVGATCWLLLLWLTRATRGPERGLWREAPTALALTATVAVGAVLVGPLASALPGYGTVRLPATWGPGIGGAPNSLSLSDNLNLRSDLGAQPGSVVLRYTTDLSRVGPLRTATLMSFDGQRWHPAPAGDVRPASGLLWPDSTSAAPDGTVQVSLVRLDQANLPITTDPRELSIGGAWSYDPARDEVVGSTHPGMSYQLTVWPRDLSAESLRADHAAQLPSGAPELAVPDTPFAGRIADLARQVVGDAPTAYDQAMALQSYFRASDFRYETNLPPAQTSDPLWDFLTARAGYCVQYATAMAIMARDLGIPARVGIGFLPGNRAADGTITVTGDRAHAWPELWFAGAGWVRFEPTPAVQTGAPPSYADPLSTSVQPTDPGNLVPSGAPSQGTAPSTAPRTGTATPGTVRTPRSALLPWTLVAVALAGAAAAIALRRRRRGSPTRWGPEEAWLRLRSEVARWGVDWTDASTPRQVAVLLHAALPATDQATPVSDAHGAVDRIVAALEAHRYAPAPDPVNPAELATWVRTISVALSAARRADAPSAPRSG